MSRQTEIQELITTYHRRLQKLKEKEATFGINTPPEVLIEIEDIESKVTHLQEELKSLAPEPFVDRPSSISERFQNNIVKREKKSPVEVLVAKIGLTGTIIIALLGLVGVGITAYFGYLGIQMQIKAPIEATQTAEAKFTALAPLVTPAVVVTTVSSINTSTPEPTHTNTPIPPTNTPPPTPTVTPLPPTDTPTPVPPPIFVTEYVLSPDEIQLVEFNAESNILPTETITDFLKLSRVAFGHLDDTEQAFDVRLVIKNTGNRPLLLDLDQRFFSLEDNQGRAKELVYFCCPAKGEMLAPGQEREIQLMFQSIWYGKGVSSAVDFRVRGFLPVVRAS